MAGSTSITPEARVGGVPIQQSAEGAPVPLLFGRNRLSANLVWYGDFESVEKRSSQGGKGGGVDTITYDYYASLIACVCQGPAKLLNLWRGKTKFTAAEAAKKLEITFLNGEAGQPIWTHLSSHMIEGKPAVYDWNTGETSTPEPQKLAHAGEDIGYSGTAYMCAARYPLDQGAQIPNHTVEVESMNYGPTPSPVTVMLALLNLAGVPNSAIGSVVDAQAYVMGIGVYACPVYTSLAACADMLSDLAIIANVGLVGSEGVLKFVPYSATPVGGYIPNTTPVFDLNDDDYIGLDEDPITITRKSEADTYNHVRVQYLDASREYNTAVAEAKDDESIARSGLRSKDTVTLNGITDAGVARLVAQQILQREIALRNTYEFTLGARHVLLEPMDYITLTDSVLGLDKVVVRVIEIEEQDDDTLLIKAEDAPYAAFHAAAYEFQKSVGFVGNYNTAPDSVAAPVFFERPIKAVPGTHLSISIAVTGAGSNWGGADIFMSLDNATYKLIGNTIKRARYGRIGTDLSINDTSVNVSLTGIGGQMYSGTPLDAESDVTLCWVGNNGLGEYVSYEGAALRATNAYTLNGVHRARFRTPALNAVSGSRFVRVESDLFQTEPLPLSMIGQTVWFKFVSRNQMGAVQQSIVDVVAYSYTITGQMVLLPPSDVEDLVLNVANNGVLITWTMCPDEDYSDTALRIGESWKSGTEVTRKNAKSHLLGWQRVGELRVFAKHYDTTKNESVVAATASLIITAPAAVKDLKLTSGITGLQVDWTMPPLAATAQPIDRVELSWSLNFSNVVEASKSTTATFSWLSSGLKELFVRAIDVAGNVGVVVSTLLVIKSPSAPTALTVSISNAGVTARWNAPNVDADQQPLAAIQLSWLADFSMIIETRSATSAQLGWLPAGAYTLYARYTDLAGNTGASASVQFVVVLPSAPTALTLTFGTANIEAKWSAPNIAANQQPLERVELSWGSAFTSVIDGKKATTTTFGWMPAGTYTLYARYVDVAGNLGLVSQTTMQVLPPNQPVMTSTEVQINAVTLRWQDAKTSQPIRKYAIWYGEAGTPLESAILYGSAGADSRSDILFYRSSGSKVAFLVAEDVAGNQSSARQIDLNITMPNNFVLATEYYEDWQASELINGTITNGSKGQIILPAYDGRTWGQRLSNSGWTTAQQKMDAGYPLVVQPVPASGKHVEQHDIGKVLAAGLVRVTPMLLSSAVGYASIVRIRGSNGDTNTNWQAWLRGDAASINNFRYIEVEYSVTSDGKGFVVLDDLYVRVEISEVTESATLTLSASDANGTPYVCTKPFLDVRNVQATALGSPNISKINCIPDDSVLPAKVYVQAWDSSNNRTGGAVSLLISGV